MPAPLVSVIIPCYRQAHYLATAIESVIAQTYPHVEIIVVNDGSDDNTDEVAASFEGRIVYVKKANGGLSSARNAGLAYATGDWVQFLDADDLLLPDKFQTQLAHADPTVDVVYSGSECFNDHDPSNRWVYASQLFGRATPFESFALDWGISLSIPIHAFLFRKIYIDQFGGFEPRLPNHEDWHWHLRVSAGRAQYRYVHAIHALYRITPVSMSRGPIDVRERMQQGKYACLEYCLVLRTLSPSQRRHIVKRYTDDMHADLVYNVWNRRMDLMARCVPCLSQQINERTKTVFFYVSLIIIYQSIIWSMHRALLRMR
jgi:glycosyltransferase involved in cell wall biosynthesis